jgi:hypothetical protein
LTLTITGLVQNVNHEFVVRVHNASRPLKEHRDCQKRQAIEKNGLIWEACYKSQGFSFWVLEVLNAPILNSSQI